MGCRSIALAVTLVAAVSLSACRGAAPPLPKGPSPASRVQAEQDRTTVRLAKLTHERLRWPEDRALFMDAARSAWAFVDRHYQPATGFVTPLGTYPFATIWDIGSMLAALYSAHELGLVDDPTFDARLDTMLATLTRIPLSGNRAFNKVYDTRTGAMPPFGHGAAGQGAGWSTTDLGRLLIWLKIAGTSDRFKHKAEAVVRRNDFTHLVKSGYLWGQSVNADGRAQTYLEGHVGYEQYAARGFALWGYRAEKALSLKENALPISVMGQPLLADFRRWDRLTNEPFLLWGMELGWDPQTASVARRLLLAQEARYRKTGILTVTGEDTIPQPPHHFFYYCVYAGGRDFAVDVQDRKAVVEGPRWISAKSAFGFHALMPTGYTAAAVRALDAAHGPAGWASGVYEGTGRPTGNMNINTAAVILTAALVDARGTPVLATAQASSR